MLTLAVIQGPDRGRTFTLPDHEPQLLGRSSEALPISDTAVSRRHAELTPDDGRWFIRDLSSQNGTWVNGQRITARTALRDGDQIRIGTTVFLFGRAAPAPDSGVIRLLGPAQINTAVERALPSNEDSAFFPVLTSAAGAAPPRAEPAAAGGWSAGADAGAPSGPTARAEPPDPVELATAAAALDHLRILYRLTQLTSASADRRELLRAAMDLIFREFKPERGFIVLCSADELMLGGPVRPAAVKHRLPPLDAEAKQIHVSRTILLHALRKGEGVLSTNAMADPRFAAGDSVQRLLIRSALCSPIRSRERTFGAIYIDSSLASDAFTPEQLALLNAVGQHTGLALANAELQAQKLQSERLAAIGETVASLSHSIKNILQGLRGGADVVEMGLKRDDLKIARDGWGILKRNLDRIVSLTLNMLAFSRQRRAEVELTRLGPIIDEAASLLEGQCAAKRVALLVDTDPEMPPVPLDASLIHQALVNLLTNALEAVEPEKGHITVRSTYHAAGSRGEGSPAAAEIAVIDNGPGIPRDRHARVFEPFQTTKGTRGTGLGLAVTRRIVEQHHGLIRLESDEGEGATFRVFLPADPRQAIDPSATSAVQGLGAGADLDLPL